MAQIRRVVKNKSKVGTKTPDIGKGDTKIEASSTARSGTVSLLFTCVVMFALI